MFNYLDHDQYQCEFIQIAPVEDLPKGDRLFVEVDDKQIVLFNLAGTLYALDLSGMGRSMGTRSSVRDMVRVSTFALVRHCYCQQPLIFRHTRFV